jgi:signal transduction histidine kinase
VVVNIDVPDLRFAPANELLLLRVALEALRNIDAHAHASQVDITLTKTGNAVALSIRDNGIGFDNEMATSQRQIGHLGLQLLRDLAQDMGATLAVDSTPGSGTTLHLELDDNR